MNPSMKSFLKRQWPLIGVGVLLAVVAIYLIKSGKEVAQEPRIENEGSKEGLKLKDIHYTHDDPDKGVKWILDAREVKFSEDKSSIYFHNFHLRLEPEKKPWFKLKGKEGNYSEHSGDINLWGDLEGFSENGYRIITEHILINEKRGHVSTDKHVEIFGPFFTVKGRGLFVDLEKKTLKIFSDVTTTLKKETLI